MCALVHRICKEKRAETKLEGKLHSKITTSDLEGLFFVKLNGETLRSKFEQECSQTDDRKRPTTAGDEYAAGITSLVPGIKNSRLRNGPGFLFFFLPVYILQGWPDS